MKKIYLTPEARFVKIVTSSVLAQSPGIPKISESGEGDEENPSADMIYGQD